MQPLRRAHLSIWIALPALLALLFAAAILVRRTEAPRNADLYWEKYK